MDDAKLVNYKHRLEAYRKTLEKEKLTGLPSDKHLGGGFRVPGQIWSKLYKYCKIIFIYIIFQSFTYVIHKSLYSQTPEDSRALALGIAFTASRWYPG